MIVLLETIFLLCIISIGNVLSMCAHDHHPKPNNNKPTFNAVSHDMKLLCYYGSWAVYRPGDGKFPVESIDPNLCTHYIYGFAGLGYDNKIKSLDPYYDLEENYGKGAFKRFTNLKKINSNLKTLIAIGGWNEGSIKYSNMAASPDLRRVFVESVVEFLQKYGFDGLDLDWEYPAARGGKPEDKRNYVDLLREIKQAFAPHGFLLTAAVSAGKWFMDPAYDIPQVSEYLDIINVMCYDYHGGWENKTGHNAPLYNRPDEVDTDRISNVNFSINYWLSKGAPKNKIALGMGSYGRSFTLQRAESNTLGAFAPQKGQAGPYTREAGSLGYNEICESRMREQWTEVRDPYHMAPYAYRDRQWVGYDDIESITIKAKYIKAMGLAGGMIWSVETDDFQGKCHGEKYPLLKAINRAFEADVGPIPVPNVPSGGTTETTQSSTTPSTSTTWSWTSPSSTVSSTMSTTSTTTASPWSSSTSDPWSSSSSSTSSTSNPWESSSSTMASTSTTTKWPWAATHPPLERSSTTSTTMSPSSSTEESGDGDSSNPSDFVCPSAGMFPHPTDCKKFYQCAQSNSPGKYRKYEIDCPDGTAFDPNIKSCAWADGVDQCKKNKQKPKRRTFPNPTPNHFRPSFKTTSRPTFRPTQASTKRTTQSQLEREEVA